MAIRLTKAEAKRLGFDKRKGFGDTKNGVAVSSGGWCCEWSDKAFRMVLPYPPSVNHYWRHVGRKVLISREGREYRQRILGVGVFGEGLPMKGELAVMIEVYPPDRRRRDIDNTQKALLDSLQYAGVYGDDSQIADLHVKRRSVRRGGEVVVTIQRIVL